MSTTHFYVLRLERWAQEDKGRPANAGGISGKGAPTIQEAAANLLAAADENIGHVAHHMERAESERTELRAALLDFARRLADE